MISSIAEMVGSAFLVFIIVILAIFAQGALLVD